MIYSFDTNSVFVFCFALSDIFCSLCLQSRCKRMLETTCSPWGQRSKLFLLTWSTTPSLSTKSFLWHHLKDLGSHPILYYNDFNNEYCFWFFTYQQRQKNVTIANNITLYLTSNSTSNLMSDYVRSNRNMTSLTILSSLATFRLGSSTALHEWLVFRQFNSLAARIFDVWQVLVLATQHIGSLAARQLNVRSTSSHSLRAHMEKCL